RAAGGIWFWILKYAFRKYADCCDAFFGHCGDKRALEVALAAGFIQSAHEHIIVNWHKPLQDNFKRALETTPKLGFVETGIQYLLVNFLRDSSPRRRREMTAKAASFMPF
ncbi:MAG TPA: hypothetical protein VHQ21_02110, partial [Rhodanobacteraceae bacterium]|nr:hypothetical protein [Rhodanobacteraceae bacterium]